MLQRRLAERSLYVQSITRSTSEQNLLLVVQEFFSVQVELGPNGVEKILPIGKVSETEAGLLKTAAEELEGNIKKVSNLQPRRTWGQFLIFHAQGSSFIVSPSL